MYKTYQRETKGETAFFVCVLASRRREPVLTLEVPPLESLPYGMFPSVYFMA